jgi:(heptosyl)LPS beta-1,4-glucosyltransferase
MCWDASLPPEFVERIWRDPHALLAEGVTLQDKPRCTVVRLDDPAGSFVWKHHNWGTIRRTIKRSLSRSTARKSWLDGLFLSEAGVPTPRPRAFIERQLGPFQRCSYILTDYVPGTSLYRLMRFGCPAPAMIQDLARQVASIWQQLDDLRVWHNDFKTENLLVDPQGKLWIIDLERTRRYHNVHRMRCRQARDVADLLHPRNWRAHPEAAEVFRRAILQTPAAAATLAGPQGIGHPLSRPVPAVNRSAQLVTVLIPCRNAAETILTCLDSVRDMADEILVADAGSTDHTLDLVREFGGCRILERSSADDASFEAWAQSHARHDWILRILPEEQLNPDLARQVQDKLAAEPREDGFLVSRSFHFRGQRLKFGDFRSDSSIRLYRKDAARYEITDGSVKVRLDSERIGALRSRLVVELCPSLDRYLSDMRSVARQLARRDFDRGLRPKRRHVLLRAPWKFLSSYALRRGWLDGLPGLHASLLSALALYLREASLWDLCQPAALRNGRLPARMHELRVFDPNAASEPAIDALEVEYRANRTLQETADREQIKTAA